MPKVKRRKSNSGLRTILVAAVIAVLLWGLIVATYLSRQSQDVRQEAAYTGEVGTCSTSFSYVFPPGSEADFLKRFSLKNTMLENSGLTFKMVASRSGEFATATSLIPYSGDLEFETTVNSFTTNFRQDEDVRTFSPMFRMGDQDAAKLVISQTPQGKTLLLQQTSRGVTTTKNSIALPALPLRLRLTKRGGQVFAYYRQPNGSYVEVGKTDGIFTQPVTLALWLSQGRVLDLNSTNQAVVSALSLRCPEVAAGSDRRNFVIQAFTDTNRNHRMDSGEPGVGTILYWDRNGENHWRKYETSASNSGKGETFREVSGGDIVRVRSSAPPYNSGYHEETFIVSKSATTIAQYPIQPPPTPTPSPRIVYVTPVPTATPRPTPTATPTPSPSMSPTPLPQVAVVTPLPTATPQPMVTPKPEPESGNFITRFFRNIYCFFARCER